MSVCLAFVIIASGLIGTSGVSGVLGRSTAVPVDYLDDLGFFELSMFEFGSGPPSTAYEEYKNNRLAPAVEACDKAVRAGGRSEDFALRVIIAEKVGNVASFRATVIKEIQASIAKRNPIPLSRAIGLFTTLSGMLRSGAGEARSGPESLLRDYVGKKALGVLGKTRNDLILQCVAATFLKNQEDERRFGEALVRAYPSFAPGFAYCASRYLSGHSAVFNGQGQKTGGPLRPNFSRASVLVKRALELDPKYARAWYVNATVQTEKSVQADSLRKFLKLASPVHPKLKEARTKLARLGG